jgi:hypothetical protein
MQDGDSAIIIGKTSGRVTSGEENQIRCNINNEATKLMRGNTLKETQTSQR